MKPGRFLVMFLLAAAVGFGLAACEKKGPAERAGEQIDKAVEKAAEKAEETGKKVGDAAKETAEKVEKTFDRK